MTTNRARNRSSLAFPVDDTDSSARDDTSFVLAPGPSAKQQQRDTDAYAKAIHTAQRRYSRHALATIEHEKHHQQQQQQELLQRRKLSCFVDADDKKQHRRQSAVETGIDPWAIDFDLAKPPPPPREHKLAPAKGRALMLSERRTGDDDAAAESNLFENSERPFVLRQPDGGGDVQRRPQTAPAAAKRKQSLNFTPYQSTMQQQLQQQQQQQPSPGGELQISALPPALPLVLTPLSSQRLDDDGMSDVTEVLSRASQQQQRHQQLHEQQQEQQQQRPAPRHVSPDGARRDYTLRPEDGAERSAAGSAPRRMSVLVTPLASRRESTFPEEHEEEEEKRAAAAITPAAAAAAEAIHVEQDESAARENLLREQQQLEDKCEAEEAAAEEAEAGSAARRRAEAMRQKKQAASPPVAGSSSSSRSPAPTQLPFGLRVRKFDCDNVLRANAAMKRSWARNAAAPMSVPLDEPSSPRQQQSPDDSVSVSPQQQQQQQQQHQQQQQQRVPAPPAFSPRQHRANLLQLQQRPTTAPSIRSYNAAGALCASINNYGGDVDADSSSQRPLSAALAGSRVASSNNKSMSASTAAAFSSANDETSVEVAEHLLSAIDQRKRQHDKKCDDLQKSLPRPRLVKFWEETPAAQFDDDENVNKKSQWQRQRQPQQHVQEQDADINELPDLADDIADDTAAEREYGAVAATIPDDAEEHDSPTPVRFHRHEKKKPKPLQSLVVSGIGGDGADSIFGGNVSAMMARSRTAEPHIVAPPPANAPPGHTREGIRGSLRPMSALTRRAVATSQRY